MTNLIHREAHRVLSVCERREPAVGSAHRQERATHYPVRVTVDEMVRRVPVQDGEVGSRIRAREEL